MTKSVENPTSSLIDESQSWLLAVLDSTSDAVIAADLDRHIVSVNPAACSIFGYTPAEFLEVSVLDTTMPERVAIVNGILDRLRRGERVDHYRTLLVRKNGEAFPASLAVAPIMRDGSEVVGFSAVVRDLSVDKEAEERRRLLDALVQCSPDAIYSRSLKGMIKSWNQSAVDLFGFNEDEIIGRSIRKIVPPEGETELGAFTAKIVRGEMVQAYETIRLTKDRRRIPVSLTIFPIRDESGSVNAIGCIARDMLRSAAQQRLFLKLKTLSPRERDVLGLVADGLGNKEISDDLGLSEQTVKNYFSRTLLKLGVSTRTQAAAEFMAFRAFLADGLDG